MKGRTLLRWTLAALLVVLLLIFTAKGFEQARDQSRLRHASEAPPLPIPALENLIDDPTAGYTEHYVVAPGTFPMSHGSSLAELPDGSLLCAWYSGTREAYADVNIYCSRFDPAQKTWSAPKAATRYGERAEWSLFKTRTVGNASLYVDDEGIVWMFYAAVQHGGWSGARVDYKTSRDSGKTWSRPKTLIHEWSNLPRSKPVRLERNRFALPLYHNYGQKHAYTCTLTVAGGAITSKSFEPISGEMHTQAAIVRHDENELFAYMRDPTKKSLMFSRFDVAQKKWSTAERLQLPNPNSAVEAERTPDGKILLVYNDSPRLRVPLSLAYSDDGRDFRKIADIEVETRGTYFSYPAMIRASDGTYHLTYSDRIRRTIKHVQFSQAWLDAKIAASAQ